MSVPADPIAALHERFRASFAQKRAELMAALDTWRSQPDEFAHTAALYLLTHKLAGSAGAYGFDALGDLARRADRLLQPHVCDALAMSPARIAPIDAAVQNLCDSIEAA